MSIQVAKLQEGPIVQSTISGDSHHLGFPVTVAAAIVALFPEGKLATDPADTVKVATIDGRAHPIQVLLGRVETVPFEFRVYPMGIVETSQGPENMDMLLGYDEDADEYRIAFTATEDRAHIKDDEFGGHMASLRFAGSELPKVLEVLGADYSDAQSVEEVDDLPFVEA